METYDSLDGIATLRRGDHVCWTYDGDHEHAAVLQAFLTAGLPANERVLYFGTDAEVDDVLTGLRDARQDPQHLITTGQLVVGNAEAAYLPDGQFDAQDRIDGFRQVARQAVGDGYAGVRVAGENTEVLNHPTLRQQDWYDYEIRVELLIAAEPILGMCCFDRRRCDDSAVAILDAVHRVRLADVAEPLLSFTVHGRADGRLALSGEIDAFNTDTLQRILDGPAGHLDPMVIDVRGLEFIDAAGVRTLERVARGRAADRGPLQLHGATDLLRRVMTLAGTGPARTLVLDA